MALADEINFKIDEVAENYALQLLQAGNTAWRNARGFILDLTTEERGKIVGGQTQIIPEVDNALVAAIQSSRMIRAKERLKNQLAPIRVMVREFYEDKFETVAPYEATRIAGGLTESTKNLIDSELGEDQFITHVVSPATQALINHLNGGSTIDATLQDMEHRIANGLEAWSQLRVFTILQQYSRDINLIFGGAFSTRVRYIGPEDERNREFCADRLVEQDNRKTKSFSIEEVSQWPQQYAPWGGMLPSTNASNIFTNAGGYNCRHIFEYLTIDE